MPNYVVEIKTETTWRMRVDSDLSATEVWDGICDQVEETNPQDIGAYVETAYVKDVLVRKPYNWEDV